MTVRATWVGWESRAAQEQMGLPQLPVQQELAEQEPVRQVPQTGLRCQVLLAQAMSGREPLVVPQARQTDLPN